MKTVIELKINGQVHEVLIEPHRTLLEVLRETIGLTGTKEACDTGDCGSCAVIIDGVAVDSCLVLPLNAQGKEITTIEGLENNGKLHPVQDAFIQYGALQCGFCTSGMIMTSKAFLDENPNPTELEIRQAISGNLCRCTGYAKIIEAVQAAAKG